MVSAVHSSSFHLLPTSRFQELSLEISALETQLQEAAAEKVAVEEATRETVGTLHTTIETLRVDAARQAAHAATLGAQLEQLGVHCTQR